ncbi:MAG: hypothetical protein ACLFSB_11450 [Chitinispirillaceae bacterium]
MRRWAEKCNDPTEVASTFGAYHLFENLRDLIYTGPTGTNVMDIQLMSIFD